MTREEAISWLKHCATTKCENCVNEVFPEEYCDDMQLKCVETLERAISALSAEPSVSIQPKTIANSCDLISRADAMSKCKNAENELTDEAERKGVRVARFIIGEMPSADRPTVVHCRECVRKKNCWMFDEHKDDNGTCVWAEPYYITESQNDVVEKNDEVIERPIIEHDREWIIGCIKHDGFIKTDRFDKANQIILDALADRPSGEWEYDVDADDSFCTNCHKYAIRDMEMQLESDFCPNCGARMENTK